MNVRGNQRNDIYSAILLIVLPLSSTSILAADSRLERIVVHGKGFATASGKPFIPWGFNYDHDRDGRLLEDYWLDEWASVERDFEEMADLGANVVRVHLQFGRFMTSATEPDRRALEQWGRLLDLAERTGLYLDVTGLGCYHRRDVPVWYDAMSEEERWGAQETFWKAIAERGSRSTAVFCYDLMNEPVVPGGNRVAGDWLGPPFAGKHFVQFVTLEQRNRPRPEIAREWTKRLSQAIRKSDDKHLVTVGLVHWSLDRPGLTSGFTPESVAPFLDFLSVHLYPASGKVDDAIETLRAFDIGKPVLVEETFPLKCSVPEFDEFLRRSEPYAAGWIGFYWGETREELGRGTTISDALTAGWLEIFSRGPIKSGK